MTAPSAGSRTTPTGRYFEDGYQTLIVFELDPDIQLWEKTAQPPGIDGGDGIDVTTMHNVEWRTMAARVLKKLTDSKFSAGYKGASFEQVNDLCNRETTITVILPNGSKIAFYGYLKSAEPGDHSEGEMPEIEVTIVATMRDPVTGTEETFTYVAATGTGT